MTRPTDDQPLIVNGHVMWAPTPPTLSTDMFERLTIGGSFARYPRNGRYDVEHVMCGRDESATTTPARRSTWHGVPDGPLTPDVRKSVGKAVDAVLSDWHAGQHVLVRCYLGLNRSGLVVALAYMALSGASGAEAVAHLRERRSPHALCNPAFSRYVRARRAPSMAGGR